MTDRERRSAAIRCLILGLGLSILFTALSGPLKPVDGNQFVAVIATILIAWGIANSVTLFGIIFYDRP